MVAPEALAGNDAAVIESIVSFVSASLPAVAPEPAAFETCLYTSTADDDFVLDRVGAMAVVSPRSGHGFKLAPLLGEAAACLALDQEPPFDLSRFRLSRLSAR